MSNPQFYIRRNRIFLIVSILILLLVVLWGQLVVLR